MDRRSRATLAIALTMAFGCALAADDASNQDTPLRESPGTNVHGNRELPKGLFIVPWQKGEPGQISTEATRLVDEPLEPVDPEEFRQRIQEYRQGRTP